MVGPQYHQLQFEGPVDPCHSHHVLPQPEYYAAYFSRPISVVFAIQTEVRQPKTPEQKFYIVCLHSQYIHTHNMMAVTSCPHFKKGKSSKATDTQTASHTRQIRLQNVCTDMCISHQSFLACSPSMCKDICARLVFTQLHSIPCEQ